VLRFNLNKDEDFSKMTTKHPRINVTFEEAIASRLTELAKHEHKSVASLVRELALEALEMREDLYLSKVAEQLDQEGAKTIGHNEAWE
jgi:predicted DNA-binding protein